MKQSIRYLCLRFIPAVFLLFVFLFLPHLSVADVGGKTSGVGFYFDTVVTVTLYGAQDGILDEIWSACANLENLLSKTIRGSDVDRINCSGGKPVTIDPRTYEILSKAQQISVSTGGAFSVTIAPLTALWDFTGGTERMPLKEDAQELLPLVDDGRIELGEDCTVILPEGMQIDLGGIAKGYIADEIAHLIVGRVSGAILNFGGNVYVLGQKNDGTPFRVGIRDPNGAEGSSCAVISLNDLSVVTSGIYERYFIHDGHWYHHILDPMTGFSAETDLASATVVSESSMTADAVATACIVMGSEKALSYLEQEQIDALLILRNGNMLFTEDFQTKFAFKPLVASAD